MPRFSLSTEVLLPAYVGRMSLPMSSITASSCEYLLWDWCCCTSCWVWSCWVCSCCRCWCCSCNSCCWLSCMACAAPWPRLIWLGEGVARTSSDRGVPGLLITAGELTLLRSLGVDILSSITSDRLLRINPWQTSLRKLCDSLRQIPGVRCPGPGKNERGHVKLAHSQARWACKLSISNRYFIYVRRHFL